MDLSELIFRLAILKKDEANSRICLSSFFEEAIHSISFINIIQEQMLIFEVGLFFLF